MLGGKIVEFVHLKRDVGTQYQQLLVGHISSGVDRRLRSVHNVNKACHPRWGPIIHEWEVIRSVRDHHGKISATGLVHQFFDFLRRRDNLPEVMAVVQPEGSFLSSQPEAKKDSKQRYQPAVKSGEYETCSEWNA